MRAESDIHFNRHDSWRAREESLRQSALAWADLDNLLNPVRAGSNGNSFENAGAGKEMLAEFGAF
jgi:hypothetical protein